MRFRPILYALAALAASPALGATADQLRCADDKLSDQQRAGIAALFAEQHADPKDRFEAPKGTASAAYDMTYALASCANQFGWTRAKQDAASTYLIRLGKLSRVRIGHVPAWNDALERFAPFGVRVLGSGDKIEDHARQMVVAGAVANGGGAVTADHGDDVIAYLKAWQDLEAARAIFARAP